MKRAYEQKSAAVREWLDKEYPAIEAKAKAEDAVILWPDEIPVRNQATVICGYRAASPAEVRAIRVPTVNAPA